MREMRELLDTQAAAAYLHMALQTLSRWRCERGGPPYIKAGHKVLYDRAALDVWLDERVRTPTRN